MLTVKHLKTYTIYTGRKFAAFGVVDTETKEVTFRHDVIIRPDRKSFEMSLRDAKQEYLRKMDAMSDSIGTELRQ